MMRWILCLWLVTGCTLFRPIPPAPHLAPEIRLADPFADQVVEVLIPRLPEFTAVLGSAVGVRDGEVLTTKTLATLPFRMSVQTTAPTGVLVVQIWRDDVEVMRSDALPYGPKDRVFLLQTIPPNYVVTPNPLRMPQMFGVQYNEVEYGFFTADDRIYLPITELPKNRLTITAIMPDGTNANISTYEIP
jgi:hypothetical protein